MLSFINELYWELFILIQAHMQCGDQIYYFLIPNPESTVHSVHCPVHAWWCPESYWWDADNAISGLTILDISILEHHPL